MKSPAMWRRAGFWYALFAMLLATTRPAHAMHIADGILPFSWAIFWFALAAPFLASGLISLRRADRPPHFKALLGLVSAAVFVVSCMPIPVPTAGTCSHPCGTGLAAILIGPSLTVLVASVALFLQALFLAHGGLSTLGANLVSMGVVGAFTGALTFRAAQRAGASPWVAAFLAGLFSDWATYATTSLELALALHGTGSTMTMFCAVAAAFIPTQLPLGIFEGFLTAAAWRFIHARRPELLARSGLGNSPK